MKYRLKRDVTTSECPWLENDLKEGDTLFEYTGYTYGCISPRGIACTVVEGEAPFFEVPKDALDLVDKIDRPQIGAALVGDQLVPVVPGRMVRVTKLRNDMGEPHPNGINEGYTRTGVAFELPTVGQSFYVNRVGGMFVTSMVEEIIEESASGGKFKTMNSVYQWEVVNEKEEA